MLKGCDWKTPLILATEWIV